MIQNNDQWNATKQNGDNGNFFVSSSCIVTNMPVKPIRGTQCNNVSRIIDI